MVAPAPLTPVRFHEDPAARRWLAERAMRLPLVVLKFGSPILMMGALAIIVRQPNLAGQPLDVLWALAFPFAVPFVLALIYPVVRWLPQEWTIDADGVVGRGRVSGRCPWEEIARVAWEPAARLPGHVRVTFRRRPPYRSLAASMMVPPAARAAVEAWFGARAANAEPRAR